MPFSCIKWSIKQHQAKQTTKIAIPVIKEPSAATLEANITVGHVTDLCSGSPPPWTDGGFICQGRQATVMDQAVHG